jgi:tetratricopeptide (TPR) repeat protein
LDAIASSVLTSDISPNTSSSGVSTKFSGVSSLTMALRSRYRFIALVISWLACAVLGGVAAIAQTEDTFGDSSADPAQLFERGQNAHAHGDFARALELYEQAIKVLPEFPEAEYQKGSALASLGRFVEAERAFKRAIELRRNWSLPYASLGSLLVRNYRNRDQEAERILRQALTLEATNQMALRALAELRLRSGDPREAADLARSATENPDAPASGWVLRAIAERAAGDKVAASKSLDRALAIDPENVVALEERAQLLADEGDYRHALEDLKAAERLRPGDKDILSRQVVVYQRAGKTEEARRIAEMIETPKPEHDAPQDEIKVTGTPEEIAAANSDDSLKARKALEKLLEQNPSNPMLLARLGESYRIDDPARAMNYYRRAMELQPNNPNYATGYAAALVRARRFAQAILILRRVIAKFTDNYTAHANLATALYESKRFAEAVPEYEWLLKSKPDLVVAYYFIASAHDYLGEYEEALADYETFLARADAGTNRLEIEKVKLRLPSLRRQIKLGQGVKRKQKISQRSTYGNRAYLRK